MSVASSPRVWTPTPSLDPEVALSTWRPRGECWVGRWLHEGTGHGEGHPRRGRRRARVLARVQTGPADSDSGVEPPSERRTLRAGGGCPGGVAPGGAAARIRRRTDRAGHGPARVPLERVQGRAQGAAGAAELAPGAAGARAQGGMEKE